MPKQYLIRLCVIILSTAMLLVACGSQTPPTPETVVVTQEVPVEVTRLVEVEVPVTVIVQVASNESESADNAMADESAQADPDPTPTPLPTLVPTPFPTGQPGDFTQEDLAKLWDIWNLIEQDYYGDLPADDVMVDALIQAMVEQLGDQFTSYFPPAVAERINDGFRGDFTGIGAYVNTNDDGQFYIVRPIPNTPADRAGLKPGDIVTAVDGQSIQGMVTDEVVAIVRGPAGEPVVLTVLREGEADLLEVTITRDRIIVPQVDARMWEGTTIGYVRLESFNQVATEQLEQGIQALLDQGMTGLVFDLRYNGGGLLTQSITVGDLFLPAGDFLIVRDSAGNEETFTTENGQLAESIPMVLLINENSASASEIVAGAIRDTDRATIIGTNSFGKGSVQTPYGLDDGSEFRVTTARFYSPSDLEINKVGVAPDIVFDFTPEVIGDENDEGILRAIEFLQTGE